MLAKLALYSAGLINQVIDCYLSQDADYYQDLLSLAHKEIRFYLSDLRLEVKLYFSRTKMRISYAKVLHPEVSDENCLYLEGGSFDLLAFAFKKDKRSRLLSERVVRYQGDLLLLEALLKLFKERNFLENIPLPHSVKAILLKASGVVFTWQQKNLTALKATVIDYVQEELRVLPSHRHFDLLKEQVLLLDEQLDRLEAKLMSVVAGF